MKFARVDNDGWLVGLLESDEPDQGLVAVDWDAWPQPPSPGRRMRVVAGAWQWQDPRTLLQAWTEIRAEREALFAPGDKIALRAFSRGEPMPQVWSAYQQQLRDVTQQSDPFNIIWPTPPNE